MDINRMAPDGKKVLRIGGLIRSVIIILCLIAALAINYFWLKWLIGNAFKIAVFIMVILIIMQVIGDCVVRPNLMYRQHGFIMQQYSIIIREGMWFVTQVNIPLFRIQNVDIEEGWLMRKKSLVTLKLSTAGGNSEIILVDKATANHIMSNIKQASHYISEATEVSE